MKKIAAISTGCFILVIGMFLLFGNSPEQDTAIPKTVQSQSPAKKEILQEKPAELKVEEQIESPAEDEFPITKEQFESLPIAEQQEILEKFVTDFWQDELVPAEIPAPEKKYLSLDIFNRPYMQTLTEREFSQLSPEDQEKAIAETTEICREIRVHILDVIAQAKDSMAQSDFLSTEANLIYGLEMGRELSVNKEGMLITRLVGIACEKAALNQMVNLYTKVGDFSKVQIVQDQLRDIEIEVEDIKNTPKEFDGSRS